MNYMLIGKHFFTQTFIPPNLCYCVSKVQGWQLFLYLDSTCRRYRGLRLHKQLLLTALEKNIFPLAAA